MAAPSTVSDLGCPLCQKPLQDPKLLPCTHLACRDCLVTLLDDDDHATCPLCYVIILSDACWVHGDIGTLVDQLPTDLAIKELVESKDALSGDHVCGACDGDTPATSFCFECDVKLCRGCEKVHSKLAATRGHGVEEMKTLTAGHCSKLNSLAGVVEQERVALSERVRVLRDKENTLTVQIGQLEQEVRDAQAHWATMRDEVNATFDHLNEKLETRRHEMLAFLDDKEAVFIEPKKEEQRVLNKERVKAGAHASSADRLVKEASDGALLGMLDKLKGRLDVVEKTFPSARQRGGGYSGGRDLHP
nr:hypothetical protein BaRGS_002295 [Batillaria attramentaria]